MRITRDPITVAAGLLMLLLLSSLFLPRTALAHEITPTILNLKQTGAQSFELRIDANLEALMVEIGSEFDDTDQSPNASQYDRLRALDVSALASEAQPFIAALPNRLRLLDESGQPVLFEFEAVDLSIEANSDPELPRESLIDYRLNLSEPPEALTLHWPAVWGDAIFRVSQQESLIAALWVQAGELSEPVALNQGAVDQSLLDYVVIGFEHILPLGLDHILFVIGIYLLSQKLSALLWQVSAFTLAHTLTLALATLGLVTVPASVVEPLIAASISYVAIENLFRHRLSCWRIGLVFGFGLLHGLGFAGVLSEIGLNPDAFIPSLIAFNIGVELGQLAVILAMTLLLGLWFSKTEAWETWIRRPISLFIAAVGAFWFVERIFL